MASMWPSWLKAKKSEPVTETAPAEKHQELALQVEFAVAALHAVAREYRELQTKFGLVCDPAGNILQCNTPDFDVRSELEGQCRDLARRHDQALRRFYRACSVYAGSRVERRN